MPADGPARRSRRGDETVTAPTVSAPANTGTAIETMSPSARPVGRLAGERRGELRRRGHVVADGRDVSPAVGDDDAVVVGDDDAAVVAVGVVGHRVGQCDPASVSPTDTVVASAPSAA